MSAQVPFHQSSEAFTPNEEILANLVVAERDLLRSVLLEVRGKFVRREVLAIALDALRRAAEDHNCDYCRADVASVERALGGGCPAETPMGSCVPSCGDRMCEALDA